MTSLQTKTFLLLPPPSSLPLQQGYMMENRISGLKCDTDVFVTFEGDNVVMLQVRVRTQLFILNSMLFKIKSYQKKSKVFCTFLSLSDTFI